MPRKSDATQERLTRLIQASLRISETVDFDSLLQGVLDTACSLTESRYGTIILVSDGIAQEYVFYGVTQEERRQLEDLLGGDRAGDFFDSIDAPFGWRTFMIT